MEREAGRTEAVSRTRSVARLGALVGSPLVLAACVVALVGGVGLLSTVLGYRALCQAGEQRAREVLRSRSAMLRASLADALGTADTLLARLSPHAQRSPRALPALLETMHELIAARRGVTWISASFPDGAFAGVTLDEQGRVLGQVTRRDGVERITHRHWFDQMGVPVPFRQEPDAYDPRSRPFYRLAVARRGHAWTAPYPFLPSLRPGISRVKPVFDPRDGSLRSVLTVDYDARDLTSLLERPMTPSQRQLVLAADGSVLAASGVGLRDFPARSSERPLNWSQLADAPLRIARAHTSPAAADRAQTVMVDGARWRLEQARVGALDAAPIVLLSILPEAELFARAHAEARRGLWTTALMALVGLAMSAALSANIARLRKKRVEAERAAAEARTEVAELGSYRIVSEIGAGGMGAIYRARHTLLARDAALKLIKPGAAGRHDDAAREAQFFHEARVLASLRSVHTVAVYDFGVAGDGRYFLAMELLDGLDLEELVREGGPQPPARVAAILAQVCQSLSEAHAAGLVHRDIKPANVFLCRLADWLDVVKVLDFGLTRTLESGGELALIEGTPGYMSPEQALGEAVGPESDLYAVGCVGYYLLTGHAPYRAVHTRDVMEAHVVAKVPELPAHVRAASPALSQIVTRCLAKRPEHRPTSAVALGRALRQAASDCAATFTDEMRTAFWTARPAAPVESGERTLPRIAVSLRRQAS